MYEVEFSKQVVEELKKLEPHTLKVIKNWVVRNLVASLDPTIQGRLMSKSIKDIWKYRLGEYRLFAEIEDNKIIVFCIMKSSTQNGKSFNK